jgi:Flp pilus assembly protein TadD
MVMVIFGMLAQERAAQFATEENLMRASLAGNPDSGMVCNDLGTILAQRGDYAGACAQFQRAAELMPDEASFRQNLGQVYLALGQPGEAEKQFRRGIELKPDEPTLRRQYAQLLLRLGRTREAIFQYQAAFIFQPHEVPASLRAELGGVYYQASYYRRSVAELRMAVAADPANAATRNNLAWILATGAEAAARDGAEAVRQATEASRLAHDQSATYLSTLAAAEAEAGNFPEAVRYVDQALALQNATGDTRMAGINQQLRSLYQSGQAYHAPGAPEADGD